MTSNANDPKKKKKKQKKQSSLEIMIMSMIQSSAKAVIKESLDEIFGDFFKGLK